MEIDSDVAIPRLLDVAEAGRQLCLSRTAIYDLIQERKLTRIKQGKKTCFLQAEVSEFIQKKFDEARQQSRQSATGLEA